MSGVFDQLPSVSFAPLDPAEIEKDILGRYETITGATLYPGDPVRLFLESVAMEMTILCRLIDMAGKQNLLAFASGSHLDHLGALMATSRLPAAPARCVLRFELAEALDFAVLIPQGTRAGTQDRRISFATDAAASISAGELFVDATATADTPGADGNGLLAGQVSLLIDPIAYVTRVTNTAMTMGGAEVEADARYRERIHLAPESFTCAGPEQAYRYHALRVNPDIAEVAVWSPKPGHVDVRPVLNGGELPDAATLEAVRAALSAEDVRPLTDTVTVAAPEPVPYRTSAPRGFRAGGQHHGGGTGRCGRIPPVAALRPRPGHQPHTAHRPCGTRRGQARGSGGTGVHPAQGLANRPRNRNRICLHGD